MLAALISDQMRNKDKDIIFLIDKMLEPHGINCQHVMDNPKVDGNDWYDHYTWTDKEQSDFKDFAINYLAKAWKMSKKYTTKEVRMFILMWGLKVSDQTLDKH